MQIKALWGLCLAGLIVSACVGPGVPGAGEAERSSGPASSRTLVAARVEPQSLATRPLVAAGVGLYLPSRMFNAQIALLDSQGAPQPYLVEALPQLNTETWKLSADGSMETVYKLRPNVSWHDGSPLSAEDFVFGWRTYANPSFGQARLTPFNAIQEVLASDARTLVIRWRQAYPDVAFVSGPGVEFPALPRHVLEGAAQTDRPDTFLNHPFWTADYVGLGPFQLTAWEPGAFLEASAFEAHVLGRPKIERIRLLFISDARAVLASLLSGDIHLADGSSIGLPEVAVLQREWISKGLGGVVFDPNQWRAAHIQHRPELASPALLDPSVRKALAHAVDRESLNEAIYDGVAQLSDSPFAPTSIWGPAAQRGAAKYPFDLRRRQQLMQEAGFQEGTDGFFTRASDGRLSFEVKTTAGSEGELSALTSSWRQVGFDAQEAVLPRALQSDPESRATFPGVFIYSTGCCAPALLSFTSAGIASAETRWTGANRSGWSDPEYDRLAEAFYQTLERPEREQQISRMIQIFTSSAGVISLFFRPTPWLYAAEVRGIGQATPEGNTSWNIQEWELR